MSGRGESSVLLLDTHVLIWFSTGNKLLSRAARDAIESAESELSLSAVTAWEYGDLHARGRLGPIGPVEVLQAALGFAVLDFPADLWRKAVELPPLHRDPVDRMVVAHAMATGATLVTADQTVRRYPVQTLW